MAHVARLRPEDFGRTPVPVAASEFDARVLNPSGAISGSPNSGVSGAITEAVTRRTTAPSIPHDAEPVHMERARRRHWRRPRSEH